jgi:hypothetical protein
MVLVDGATVGAPPEPQPWSCRPGRGTVSSGSYRMGATVGDQGPKRALACQLTAVHAGVGFLVSVVPRSRQRARTRSGARRVPAGARHGWRPMVPSVAPDPCPDPSVRLRRGHRQQRDMRHRLGPGQVPGPGPRLAYHPRIVATPRMLSARLGPVLRVRSPYLSGSDRRENLRSSACARRTREGTSAVPGPRRRAIPRARAGRTGARAPRCAGGASFGRLPPRLFGPRGPCRTGGSLFRGPMCLREKLYYAV